MITLLRIASIVAATALLGSWASTEVNAQTSLCYQRCTTQYGWPQPQCASYCKRQDSRTRVYGYTRRANPEEGYAGGCGTYRYWNGAACLDARDK